MGGSTYSTVNRAARAISSNYHSAPIETIFVQQKVRRVHESMDSTKIKLREARDSETHPETIPIIVALDLTGSMGFIPHHLVKNGLPTLMSGIIQNGLKDPALLFLGVGDHETDDYPLQIGQFESGDEELDMWLTRTYIEGGGGANGGESYSLAHYFAARHTKTDAWDKRKTKGILITIGDEPNLISYPGDSMRTITGDSNISSFNDKDILEEAQEKWEVYHIYPVKFYERKDTTEYWKQLLGERFFSVENEKEIVETIKDIVIKHSLNKISNKKITKNKETKSDSETEIL